MKIACDWCGKQMERTQSGIKKHNFCCRQCLADFSSKKKNPAGYALLKDYTNISAHCSAMNKELNPSRMTVEVRAKLRESKIKSGNGKSYAKLYGRHEHRVVAEQLLGRKLRPGEVVHHIDGNKRNNVPQNIRVFASQSEHAKFHMELNLFIEAIKMMDCTGGDAQ